MLSQQVMTLSQESIERFRSSLSAKGRSDDTVKAYTTDLKVLLQELEVTQIPLTELEECAANWLTANRRRVAPKTTGRRLTSLRAFGRWAGMGQQILADYSAPTPAKSIPHPLPEGMEGVRRLIEITRNEKQQALIALCGYCGLRVSEALRTEPGDFDLHDMLLTVHGKGDKERIVPVSQAAWEILAVPMTRALCEGGRPVVNLQDRFARRVITELGRKAKLKREISSHDLRATFATAVFDKTKNLRLVQELLGHANSTTTEVYTGVAMSAMKQAVEGI